MKLNSNDVNLPRNMRIRRYLLCKSP